MITLSQLIKALAVFPPDAQTYADDDGDLVIMDAADENRLGIIYLERCEVEDQRPEWTIRYPIGR